MAESKIPSLKNKIRSQIRMLRAELQKPEAIGRKETMDAQIREQVLALLSRLRAEKNAAGTDRTGKDGTGFDGEFRLHKGSVMAGFIRSSSDCGGRHGEDIEGVP